MEKAAILLLSLALVSLPAVADETGEGLPRAYAGLSGALTLPQGGARVGRVGGGAVRVGAYLSDDLAAEGEVAWLEDAVCLQAGLLAHLQGWSLYGDLFGYSRFDPFVTVGARGWLGNGSGQVGPKAGLGAFWHLTDNWALRADAESVLGIETARDVLFHVSAGVQFSF